MFRRWPLREDWLWPDLGTDCFQGLDARRQKIAVAIATRPSNSRSRALGFFVGQVKVHAPDMGSLTSGGESARQRPGVNRTQGALVKGDLAIRPIFHQDQARIEAHIFIAFLAYCLHATLARRLHALAPGLSPRSVIEKFAAMQMIDVHVPTTDGRELLLTRYTEPDAELRLLLDKLKLALPAQSPPKITTAQIAPQPPA
jgi:hypothetical protein